LVYKRTLLVQNTLGSEDSPMINTLEILDSLVYYTSGSFICKAVLMLVQSTLRSRLPDVFIARESRLHKLFITRESRLPGVFTTRESRLASVFITGELIWTPESHFIDFKEHTTIFKGSIILKLNCRLLNFLRTCALCFQKLPNLRDSNRLPSVFNTWESITNTNNSTNIQKNLNSFLGLPIGTRRSCLMKKTQRRKIS
jgi:hypothetical protein